MTTESVPHAPLHGKQTLALYLAWVKAWCSVPEDPLVNQRTADMTLEDVCNIFGESDTKFPPLATLESAVIVFREEFARGRVTLGGKRPPLSNQINLLSEDYNPKTSCECNGIGLSSAPSNISFVDPFP
jgi:hypothetical protein